MKRLFWCLLISILFSLPPHCMAQSNKLGLVKDPKTLILKSPLDVPIKVTLISGKVVEGRLADRNEDSCVVSLSNKLTKWICYSDIRDAKISNGFFRKLARTVKPVTQVLFFPVVV